MAATGLIPAELRARLRELRIAPRRATASGGLGQHVSRNRGAGLEFAQYRAYEPGDEPRRIDWKLYARSDRYFVRESERDSALNVWVLLDCTASMALADVVRPEFSKQAAAKTLAACIFELCLRQGDRFGLVSIGAAGLTMLPAGSGTRQRDRCTLELDRLQAGGAWPAAAQLRPLWDQVPPAAMVIVLSDFFDDGLTELVERLAAARREMLSVQIIGADERDFPFKGGHRFSDPESGAELLADGAAVRGDFIARFASARAQLARRMAAAGVRHGEFVLDQSLDQPLRRFFAIRSAESASA